MKFSFVLPLMLGFTASALADIQDPPSNYYGPTRKLGRGSSNMVFAAADIPVAIGETNSREGNVAAATYGVVRGSRRAFARFGVGLYEVLLWPLPIRNGSSMPALENDILWIHRG